MKSKSLMLLNAYWIFSIIYYCFGKWQWNIPSYFLLLSYLLINYLALNWGYKFADVSKYKEIELSTSSRYDPSEQFKKIRIIFLICCICTIIFEIAWVVTFLGKFSILDVFQNLGQNYYDKMEAEFDSPVLIMQIRTLLWIVTYFAFPVGFMFFKEMSLPYKLLFITTVGVEILASLNVGISKYIGDLAIIFIAVVLIKVFSSQKTRDNNSKKDNKSFIKIVVVGVVFLVALGIVQSLRGASSNVVENPYGSFASIRDYSLFDILFGKNSIVTSIIDNLGVYCSHAYTGLAYALELPFESTNLTGFSKAFMSYLEQYLGIASPIEHTYNARIEYMFGWKDGQWWPTAFVYIGNAVSLWLVPVVMWFLGNLFREVECRWRTQKQITSLILYCQLFIAMIYLPCNAQIVQGRQALIATVLLFVIYFFLNSPVKLRKTKE